MRIKALGRAEIGQVNRDGSMKINGFLFTGQDNGVYSEVLTETQAMLFDGVPNFAICHDDFSIVKGTDPTDLPLRLEEGIDYFPDSQGSGEVSAELYELGKDVVEGVTTPDPEPEPEKEEPTEPEVDLSPQLPDPDTVDINEDGPIVFSDPADAARAEELSALTVSQLHSVAQEINEQQAGAVKNYKRLKKEDNSIYAAIIEGEKATGYQVDLGKFFE